MVGNSTSKTALLLTACYYLPPAVASGRRRGRLVRDRVGVRAEVRARAGARARARARVGGRARVRVVAAAVVEQTAVGVMGRVE